MDLGIPVGISGCLLGEAVRPDGGHNRDRFVAGVLGTYFRWVSVCPEIGAGFGVPRESLRLERAGDGERLLGNRTDADKTDAVDRFARRHVEDLAPLRLRGFILKSHSPTCGPRGVRVYEPGKAPSRTGTGIYARRLQERYPHLPVEAEDRLEDPRIRENFVTRVFTFDRWIRLLESDPRPRDIVDFHTRHKMLLLAHSEHHYRRAGALVARAGLEPLPTLVAEYESLLMEGLKRIASPGQHANVLQHLAGFLKKDLDGDDKRELETLIHDYRAGRVPLAAPLILLYHHLDHLKDDWVDSQVYLQPFPLELALRSSI